MEQVFKNIQAIEWHVVCLPLPSSSNLSPIPEINAQNIPSDLVSAACSLWNVIGMLGCQVLTWEAVILWVTGRYWWSVGETCETEGVYSGGCSGRPALRRASKYAFSLSLSL